LAAKQHDSFVKILRKNNVKIHYLEDLVAQTYQAASPAQRIVFINKFINEAHVAGKTKKAMFNFLKKLPALKLVNNMIEGVSSKQLGLSRKPDIFLTEPLVNTYFTRDPFACFANGVTIHTMKYDIRKRETLFG
jgi:arginine deiminase